MTANDLLQQALQAGLHFEADGEHLRVRGDEAVIGAWAERLLKSGARVEDAAADWLTFDMIR